MRVVANGIGIEVDDQGLPGGEPLLLIMGLGMQLVGWPEELVQMLVSRGFRVLRMDNRDIGLSQHFDHLGSPNLVWAATRHALSLPLRSPYSLADMAQDCVGVLDALGVSQAHVCGASMGGMIAQHLAAKHPRRVKSLTLMMTTSGARHLPQASWQMRSALLGRPLGPDIVAAAQHLQQVMKVIGSPAYAPDPERLQKRLQASVRRSWHPQGTARQMVAIAADGDRSNMLRQISAPTLVLHGNADPLVPVAAGHDLVAKIEGAVGDFVEGMGHDLPLQLLPHFAQAVAHNAACQPR